MSSHGRFAGASSIPFSEYKRKQGDRVGLNKNRSLLSLIFGKATAARNGNAGSGRPRTFEVVSGVRFARPNDFFFEPSSVEASGRTLVITNQKKQTAWIALIAVSSEFPNL
jgi:hypothetical protein